MDGHKVEWEDDLPMKEFALRVPLWLAWRLPEILDKMVASGQADRMQKNLGCVWRLYWWTRPHGRAFEMTMCVLKARLLKAKPQIDFGTCTMTCGDGRKWEINGPPPASV